MIILGRKVRVRYIILGDIFLTIISVFAAYILRLDLVAIFPTYQRSLIWMLAISVLVKPTIYFLLGMYRRIWRYASIREMALVITAVTAASMVISVFMISLFAFEQFIGFPRSVLVIDWVLSILLIGSFRISSRVLSESRSMGNGLKKGNLPKSVLIVGAGEAGVMVVRELRKNPQLNQIPVGFLDDDPEKQKHEIQGVKVIGTLPELGRVLKMRQVDEVVIAIPSAAGSVIRMVAQTCRENQVPFRTMPGIYDLLDGKISVSRLREVNIDDLLRREPAQINNEAIGSSMKGKKVLITGAGGSIGRELCRQIARNDPDKLLMLGHGENSIFEALLEMKESFPNLTILPIIADVRGTARIQGIFEKYQPDIVFHTAAHKHVPMMELNIEEAITNNVIGTKNIVNACINSNVEKLVMISTDKAIRPANIMGATKRIAEMLVLDGARRSGKAFSVVRFGNVLGSRGSVVPRFKQQIAKGGPVSVTHPDMRRYFMTIPEAVHLVLQASIMGHGTEIFVLNMGEQIKILDLAQDLIRLSGLEPGKDIEIQFLGIRPGEKLSEDLWDEGFEFSPTEHPDVYKVETDDNLESDRLDLLIEELVKNAYAGNNIEIIKLLEENIPGTSLKAEPIDLTVIS